MGLAELTREAVIAAMGEYDRRGRDTFLNKYGFGQAHGYMIEANGHTYDSKAIAGVAHGYLSGHDALKPGDFTGGEASVAHRLRKLGFIVPPTRSPAWARDEVILACDVVMNNGWNYLTATDAQVIELSRLLQLLPIHSPQVRSADFRNPNGVARKTADIATQHPDYTGKPTHGGRVDAEVLQDFLNTPHEMHAAALALRTALSAGELDDLPSDQDEIEDTPAREGRLLERRHYARERNPGLRKRKIAQFLKTHDRVECEVCSFDYETTYGPRGAGYIQCHHVVPLHDSGETTTKLSDLILLCASCHCMIHRGRPWLTPDELRGLLNK